ncbi:hypothetical protein SDC9_131890 [bioreactor metagenome]|uniref:Uncharacterized protein n=1 Tax=bioreactor metagenome TaxID=1076179 RepID=A0A645D656_9ZZZZ
MKRFEIAPHILFEQFQISAAGGRHIVIDRPAVFDPVVEISPAVIGIVETSTLRGFDFIGGIGPLRRFRRIDNLHRRMGDHDQFCVRRGRGELRQTVLELTVKRLAMLKRHEFFNVGLAVRPQRTFAAVNGARIVNQP